MRKDSGGYQEWYKEQHCQKLKVPNKNTCPAKVASALQLWANHEKISRLCPRPSDDDKDRGKRPSEGDKHV